MRNLFLVFVLVMLAGCGGDSALPSPTGKGTIRAINAIQQSPDIAFLIEERLLQTVPYGASSSAQQWDDFEYTFNFEVTVLGEAEPRRVASRVVKVDRDREYTFLLTGDVLAPAVTIWEQDERTFDGSEAVFQVQFGHASSTQGMLDVYFAAPGTAPVLGEQVATLGFGETSVPMDLAGGDYEVIYTVAGDPGTIVFQSASTAYVDAQQVIVVLIPSDENNTAPHSAQVLNPLGGATELVDTRFPPTIRFFQAALNLGNADVYDDEMLTNQILSDYAFGDVTGDLDTVTDTVTYTFTAAGNVGSILLETGFQAFAGRHHNFYVVETDTGFTNVAFSVDRRTIATFAKVRFFPASMNHNVLDLYIVDAGEPLDADTPLFVQLLYTLQSPNLSLLAGSYDIYLTAEDDRNTIVAGPVQLDIGLGEFQEIVVFDTVDPATAEIRLLPDP